MEIILFFAFSDVPQASKCFLKIQPNVGLIIGINCDAARHNPEVSIQIQITQITFSNHLTGVRRHPYTSPENTNLNNQTAFDKSFVDKLEGGSRSKKILIRPYFDCLASQRSLY